MQFTMLTLGVTAYKLLNAGQWLEVTPGFWVKVEKVGVLG